MGSLIVWISLAFSEPTWLASSAKAVTSSGSEIHRSVASRQLPVDSNLSQNLITGLETTTDHQRLERCERNLQPTINSGRTTLTPCRFAHSPQPLHSVEEQEQGLKTLFSVEERFRIRALEDDTLPEIAPNRTGVTKTVEGEGEQEFKLSQNSSPNLEAEPSPINNDSEPPSNGEDPELGTLRLRELEPPPLPSEPAVYLLGGVDYLRSNNIFSGITPVDDGLFRAGLTLVAVPSLGDGTSVLAAVSGSVIRYSYLWEYDYNELQLNLGIRQQIGNRTYGMVGWSNRQLFGQDGGDRFLNEHSVYLELGREDSLSQQLTLDSFYQFRLSFADPTDRSQAIHYLGVSLDYDLLPSLQLALDYQFALADFTRQERLDEYHQLLTRLTYRMSSNSQIYLFGGYSLGDSSDSATDFDGLVFGVGVDVSLPLF